MNCQGLISNHFQTIQSDIIPPNHFKSNDSNESETNQDSIPNYLIVMSNRSVASLYNESHEGINEQALILDLERRFYTKWQAGKENQRRFSMCAKIVGYIKARRSITINKPRDEIINEIQQICKSGNGIH